MTSYTRVKFSLRKHNAVLHFLLTHRLEENILQLRNSRALEIIPLQLANNLAELGKIKSCLMMTELFKHKQLHEIVYTIKSSQYQNKRWEESQQTYDDAVNTAKLLWKNGCRLKSSKMINHLMSLDEQEFPEQASLGSEFTMLRHFE